MKIKELRNAPDWLKAAIVEDEDVTIEEDGVLWHGGIWHWGNWKGDYWFDGTWHDGSWFGGEWLDGIWYGGRWYDGTWHNGLWEDGVFHNGMWENGVWKGGVFINGKWNGGVWEGGVWSGGEWCDPRIDRLLYMAAKIGIVFDEKGLAVAYRTTQKDNHGRFFPDFIQESGQVYIDDHAPAGEGTCLPGLHVTDQATAFTFLEIDYSAKLWKVTFRREDLLDCDGEKARLKGGWCEEIPWPFIKESEVKDG